MERLEMGEAVWLAYILRLAYRTGPHLFLSGLHFVMPGDGSEDGQSSINTLERLVLYYVNLIAAPCRTLDAIPTAVVVSMAHDETRCPPPLPVP